MLAGVCKFVLYTMADDVVEQTLHVARQVSVYTIPPR
jgi:hypothetical protein